MKSSNTEILSRERPWRRVVVSALVLAALAALTIVFSRPLFAVLGFEYSALMALALSFVCGIVGAGRRWTEWTPWTQFRKVVCECLTLGLVPLVVSVLSLPFLHNCSFWDG